MWGLSYDKSKKILNGKTEANADVFVISDNGQGTWKADEDGNFSCDLQLAKVGDVLKISAGFDYKFGTPIEFTIPADETTQSSKTQEKESTEDESTPKSKFPNTGEDSMKILPYLGIGLVLFLFMFIFVKYPKEKK